MAMDEESKTLLPSGLYDLLPPDAAHEAQLTRQALGVFEDFGYALVKPPLVEFERTLLARKDETMDTRTFRIMDPVSQQMMGLRADMTMQIGRIAMTRLTNEPRPLRLCYSGDTMNVRGESLRAERQFTQAGVELVGVDTALADAEVVIIAIEALAALGVTRISIDLNLPTLVSSIVDREPLSPDARAALVASIACKDTTAIEASAGKYKALLRTLVETVGPAQETLPVLLRCDLPDAARALCERLKEVIEVVARACPEVGLTLDAAENRGFEYHTGISFSVFARGIPEEIGRGGRYFITATGESTPATGFTLYINTLLRALSAPAPRQRVYVPAGTPMAAIKQLHEAGLVTINGLAAGEDASAEAKRLKCSHMYVNGNTIPVK